MTTFDELVGTRWTGTGELWLDPEGNEAKRCECTIAVEAGALRYTWSYEGKPQTGSITLRSGGADFTDTWHQPAVMPCEDVPGSWALFDVFGTYPAGDGPPWGWRTKLSLRAMGGESLVLQMTNIAPWGESGRAVRMVATRD